MLNSVRESYFKWYYSLEFSNIRKRIFERRSVIV